MHPNARLIILDTLAAFEPKSTRRNSDGYAEAYSTMELLKEVAKEFNLSILVITHTNKGTDHEWSLDAVMGSTGNTGATDATLVMAKEGDDYVLETFGRRIRNEKYIIKSHLELGLWELLEQSAEEHLMSRERKAVIDVLTQGENEPMSASQIAEDLGKFEPKEKNTVRKLCFDMKKADILEPIGSGPKSKYKLCLSYYTRPKENQGNDGNDREEASDSTESGDGFRYPAQSNSGNSGNEEPPNDIELLPPLLSFIEDGNETKHSDSIASGASVTTVTAATAQTEAQVNTIPQSHKIHQALCYVCLPALLQTMSLHQPSLTAESRSLQKGCVPCCCGSSPRPQFPPCTM